MIDPRSMLAVGFLLSAVATVACEKKIYRQAAIDALKIRLGCLRGGGAEPVTLNRPEKGDVLHSRQLSAGFRHSLALEAAIVRS